MIILKYFLYYKFNMKTIKELHNDDKPREKIVKKLL